MNRNWFRLYCAGMILLLFGACGASAIYRYYTPQMDDTCYTKSQLLGTLPKGSDPGWPDLPMTECQPSSAVKAKCVVQLVDDFASKDGALQKCQKDLVACQKGNPPQ